MLNHLLNAVSAIGNAVDLPGSSVRDLFAGRDPRDQWRTPFSDVNRTSGRDLLRHHGLIGHEDNWGNFAGGLAAETLLDPLNLIPGSWLSHTLRGRRAATEANVAIRGANQLSEAQRLMRFLPEENIAHMHPSMLDESGMPKRWYHGTPHVFDQYDMSKMSKGSLVGPGAYHTDSQKIGSSYPHKGAVPTRYEHTVTDKKGFADAYRSFEADTMAFDDRWAKQLSDDNFAHEQGLKALNNPQEIGPNVHNALRELLSPFTRSTVVDGSPMNVRMHYLDVRKPFDADAMHDVAKLDAAPHSHILQEVMEEAKSRRDSIRTEIDNIRHASRNLYFPPSKRHFLERFKDRHPLTQVSGHDFINHFDDLRDVPEAIKGVGNDSIQHIGGKHFKNDPHNVTVILDPEQAYLPYIAKKIQPLRKVPSTTPALAGLAGYNALARSAGKK